MLTLETGGDARFFTEAASETELLEALGWARAAALPVLILGGGSNLVLSDAGFPGLVVRLATRGIEVVPPAAPSADAAEVFVDVAAGEVWDNFVALAVELGLCGIECLSGIPGCAGATPLQNVGAYGQEVAQVISSVCVLDRSEQRLLTLGCAECHFAYRSSRFKHEDRERFVVLSVRFRLRRGAPTLPRSPELLKRLPDDAPSLQQIRDAVLFTRRQKSMVWDKADPNHRSCGSFFMNPILTALELAALLERAPAPPPCYPEPDGRTKVAAAWLIEQAGLQRGTRDGNVGLSTEHTLAVVAHAGATTEDVVRFARKVRDAVLLRFGVTLHPEPVFVGIDW
ncbi:MAG: hypothetical protein RJA70_2174 [Pseudomonadota bacterium]|jgi:UDP-N-acetylmuramate dehydrogenase